MKIKRLLFPVIATIVLLLTMACNKPEEQKSNAKSDATNFVITLNLNGGTLVQGENIISFTKGETVSLPVPVKEGYLFSGWFDNEEFTGARYVFLGSEYAVSDKTLWAKWEELSLSDEDNKAGSDGNVNDGKVSEKGTQQDEIYSITYFTNGGFIKNEQYPKSYKTGEITVLPEPFKSGFKFLGWYETSDFSSEAVREISADSKGDKTFYAAWELISDNKDVLIFAIDYRLNGGAFESGVAVFYEYTSGKAVTLPIPVREGYEFGGWFENDSFGGESITEISEDSSGDKILYAKWV